MFFIEGLSICIEPYILFVKGLSGCITAGFDRGLHGTVAIRLFLQIGGGGAISGVDLE